MALGARFELATLWLTARCSTIELPKNKWRMAQDLNLWSSTNDFSLAKRHNKPLCQPSMFLPPYSPCCIIRPPKDCNLDVLCSYTSILIGGSFASVSNSSPHVGLGVFIQGFTCHRFKSLQTDQFFVL